MLFAIYFYYNHLFKTILRLRYSEKKRLKTKCIIIIVTTRVSSLPPSIFTSCPHNIRTVYHCILKNSGFFFSFTRIIGRLKTFFVLLRSTVYINKHDSKYYSRVLLFVAFSVKLFMLLYWPCVRYTIRVFN